MTYIGYLTTFFVGLSLSHCSSDENALPTQGNNIIELDEKSLNISALEIDNNNADLSRNEKRTDISLRPVFFLVFSADIDAKALDKTGKLRLMKQETNIPLSIRNQENNSIIVQPTANLENETDYEFRIGKDLIVKKDNQSYKLFNDFTFSFSTIPKSAETDLSAMTLIIGEGQSNGFIEKTTVTFPVADKTITEATVQLIDIAENATSKKVNETITFKEGVSTLRVTAENGESTDYTLQLVSNIAQLSKMTISIHEDDYTINFSDSENSKAIFVKDDTAKKAILKSVSLSEGAIVSPSLNAILTFNNKQTTLSITAEDKKTVQSYHLIIKKVRLTLNALTLGIGEKQIDGFIEETTVTFPTADKTITEATVQLINIAENATSKKINDVITFNEGISTLSVIAEDGESTDYTLQLVSNIAQLSKMVISIHEVDYMVNFSDSENSKMILVEDDTAKIATLKSVSLSDGATVSPSLNAMLMFNNKQTTLSITAEDKKTVQDYHLVIKKEVLTIETLTLNINGGTPVLKILADQVLVGVVDKSVVNSAKLTSITVPKGADTVPKQGETLDFPLVNGLRIGKIVVQGEASKNYKYYNIILENTTNSITGFLFLATDNATLNKDIGGEITNTDIHVNVLASLNTLILKPHIIHNGDIIRPTLGNMQDYSVPVIFKVTSEYGDEKTYTVTVKKESQ